MPEIAQKNNQTDYRAFKIKGSQYTLAAVQIFNPEVRLFAQQLADLSSRAPNFFNNTPVLIDLQQLNEPDIEIDFQTICKHLRESRLIPVGIRGGNNIQQLNAVAAGLGIFPNQKPSKKPEDKANKPHKTNKLITKPIRSGQQVYAKDGDLIVAATVSPGAELIADGNIHIYGTLKGRALAGVSGDTSAHIFCQALAAELVSINGNYLTSEEITSFENCPVKIHLVEAKLLIEPITTS